MRCLLRVRAPAGGVVDVGGARVAIVAGRRRGRWAQLVAVRGHAPGFRVAHVHRARIVVVAGDRDADAPGRLADVVRAGVAVLAVARGAHARRVDAMVVRCARVAVVTRARGRGVDAPRRVGAVVVRAGVAIVAHDGCSLACAVHARVASRAEAAIFARPGSRLMPARAVDAGVRCAGVVVPTRVLQPEAAGRRIACVERARIAILAGHVQVNAALHRVEGVVGARVSVVAGRRGRFEDLLIAVHVVGTIFAIAGVDCVGDVDTFTIAGIGAIYYNELLILHPGSGVTIAPRREHDRSPPWR